MGISNNLGFIANVNTFPASGRSAGYELISSQQDYGLNLYSQTTDGGAEVTGIIAFAMSGAELDLTNTKINMSIRSPWRTIGPLYNTVDANISTIASLNSVNNPTARYTFNMFNNSTGSMGLCDGLSFFNFGAPVLDQEWHDITFQFSTGIVAGTGIGSLACEMFVDGVSRGKNASFTNWASVWTGTDRIDVTIGDRDNSQDNYIMEIADFKITSRGQTILYYDFNEGSGITTYNKSGRNHHALHSSTFPSIDKWSYAKSRETAQQINSAIRNNLVIPTGVHIVEPNIISIPGGTILRGDNRQSTIIRADRKYMDVRDTSRTLKNIVNPILDWPLNITSDTFLARDMGSGNFHGTVSTGLNFNLSSQYAIDGPMSQLGRAAFFNAAHTGNVTYPHHPSLFMTGGFSMEFWMKTQSGWVPSATLGVMGKFGGNNAEWDLTLNTSAHLVLVLRQGTDPFSWTFGAGSASAVNDGLWHHHVLTVPNPPTGAAYFRDGVWAHNSTFTGTWLPTIDATAKFEVGHRHLDANWFSGYMAGVRLYPMPLYPEQVRERYNSYRYNIISSEGIAGFNKGTEKWAHSGLPTEISIKDITIHGNSDNCSDGILIFNTGNPSTMNGINLFSVGTNISNVAAYKIPGVAIFVDTGGKARSGELLITDNEKSVYENIKIQKSYNGLVLEDDADATVVNYQASAMRDFGLDIRAGASYVDKVHCWGGAVGTRLGGSGAMHCGTIQGDNLNCGLILDGATTTLLQYIGKGNAWFGADFWASAQISQAIITVPAATSQHTGVYNYLYTPKKPEDITLPNVYYNNYNEAGGPMGFRIQQAASSCVINDLVMYGESATGVSTRATCGFEIRSAKNKVVGRISGLDVAGYLNYQYAHNNRFDLTIEGCQTGLVITPACTSATGCIITIYYRAMGLNSTGFIDQTTGVFSSKNTINLIPMGN